MYCMSVWNVPATAMRSETAALFEVSTQILEPVLTVKKPVVPVHSRRLGITFGLAFCPVAAGERNIKNKKANITAASGRLVPILKVFTRDSPFLT
jgi:hypothetical protein